MTFHWIMTVLVRGSFAQFNGTLIPAAGETRTSLFEQLHRRIAQETGEPSPAVVFFALEPDQLAGSTH